MNENTYGINIVSRKTGLTPHAIRKWESRYNAVTPLRSSTNRRLYNDRHINRLKNLKILTDSGYSIGQIANHSDEELSELVNDIKLYDTENQVSAADIDQESDLDDRQRLVDATLNAIIKYNSGELDNIITDSSVQHGNIWTINHLIVPAIHKIGVLWREGIMKISHEHLASEFLRSYLGNIINNSSISVSAPTIILTTPSGQHHEFGAILAAATAAIDGWNTCYLGPDLPWEEIAGAALSKNAKVVGLSIVYPGDDPGIISNLKHLREILPDQIEIIIGGQSHKDYMNYLSGSDIIFVDSLNEFRQQLERIRHLN